MAYNKNINCPGSFFETWEWLEYKGRFDVMDCMSSFLNPYAADG